ncbi:unnamed protein product, partial [Choristocarpus tenellus]
VHRPWQGLLLSTMPSPIVEPDELRAMLRDSPLAAIEAFGTCLHEVLEVLRAGPTASEGEHLLLRSFIAEHLPSFTEALHRTSMPVRVAEHAASFFAEVQEFVNACLRCPTLDDGPHYIDLSPLLHILHFLISTEDVPPRYPVTQGVVRGQMNFNREHGTPRVRIYQGQTQYFWPDDKLGLRVGNDAVGWCVEVLDANGDLLHPEPPPPGSTTVTGNISLDTKKKWLKTVILEGPFKEENSTETKDIGRRIGSGLCAGSGIWSQSEVIVDVGEGSRGGKVEGTRRNIATSFGGSEDLTYSMFKVEFESGRTSMVDLACVSLRWISFVGTREGGGQQKQEKGDPSRIPPGFSSPKKGGVGGRSVLGSEADVGVRVDIWWARYKMFYRGTLTAFDPVKSQHTLHYDDGQVCVIDMSQKPHVVVLRAPSSQATTGESNGVATTTGPTPGSAAAEGLAAAVEAEAQWAPRPPPETMTGVSMYVLDTINRLGFAGGIYATVIRRLGGPRPSFKEVLESLRIGKAVLARATTRASRETAWMLKERVPSALLMAAPETMRTATKADVAECLHILKQLAVG